MKIIAIVGMPGAGKSLLANHLKTKGFPAIRLGAIIVEEVQRRGLPLTLHNEQIVREELRNNNGMDAVVKIALPQIRSKLVESELLVIDGLYSFSEYKTLKQEFGADLVVVAVYSPPKVRYQRLASRSERPLAPDEAMERDYMEIERIEKAGPIAMADFTLINNRTRERLIKNLEIVLTSIGQQNIVET